MTADKLETSIEKIIEKIKTLDYKFADEGLQEDFSEMKSDAIGMLEDMIDMAHEDENNQDEESSED